MPNQTGLPTLKQLENALNSNDTAQIATLRQCLNWDPPGYPAGRQLEPAKFGDAAHSHLRRMIANFGPGCLVCPSSLADCDTLVHATASCCTDQASLELIREAAGADSPGCFIRRGLLNYAPVHSAAENPCNNALKWLVGLLGPSCLQDCDTALGYSPVLISALRQGADSMKFHHEQLGPDCFHQPQGRQDRTAFHLAAMNETSGEALHWLVDEFGPSALTIRDRDGDTPVHLAAWIQDKSSLHLILERLGYQAFSLQGEYNESVVHSAAQNTSTNSPLVMCINRLGPHCMLTADALGRLPLHLAAQYQNEVVLALAVQSLGKECLSLECQSGQTAAHYAASNARCGSALRYIVQQLSPQCLTLQDANHNMPLHLAAQYQDVSSLIFIRQAIGSVAFQLKGFKQRTIAHYAAKNERNRTEMLDWIEQAAGAQSLRVPDANGATPLSLAGCD